MYFEKKTCNVSVWIINRFQLQEIFKENRGTNRYFYYFILVAGNNKYVSVYLWFFPGY